MPRRVEREWKRDDPAASNVTFARKTLIAGLALGAMSLIGCPAPPPTDEGAGARGVARVATPSAPAEVMVVYQPAQICPSPQACQESSEVAWVPPGTTLEVAALHVQELPRSDVHWFRVEYEGRAGWISEFATDKAPRVRGGKIVRQ
jgi:hypothetical protein